MHLKLTESDSWGNSYQGRVLFEKAKNSTNVADKMERFLSGEKRKTDDAHWAKLSSTDRSLTGPDQLSWWYSAFSWLSVKVFFCPIAERKSNKLAFNAARPEWALQTERVPVHRLVLLIVLLTTLSHRCHKSKPIIEHGKTEKTYLKIVLWY